MSEELSEDQKRKIEGEENYRQEFRRRLLTRYPVEPESWKKTKGCLIAFGVLIGIFILISAINNSEEKKPSSTSTPTPIPAEQEKTEVATEPIPKEVVEFTEYSQKLIPINSRVTEYMTKRAEIASKWPNWANEDVIEFAATGVGLELAYDEAKKLTPPKIMVSVHQKWLKALELYKRSVPIANKGIDNLDADLIKQSVDLMQEGTEWMNKATKEVEEINKKLNE